MLDVLKGLIQDENGQGMAEYGLVLGVLATGVIFAIIALRHNIEGLYNVVTNQLIECIKYVLE